MKAIALNPGSDGLGRWERSLAGGLSLLVIKLFGPAFFSEGMARVFVKGLTAKFGTAIAHVDDLALAALFFDGRNPVELLRLLGVSNRSRSVPKATRSRGAMTGPAPGKLRKRAASGCASIAWVV